MFVLFVSDDDRFDFDDSVAYGPFHTESEARAYTAYAADDIAVNSYSIVKMLSPEFTPFQVIGAATYDANTDSLEAR
jgi:hypothetical protein